jgi:hypothetical protein
MSLSRSYEKAGPLLPSQEDQDIEAKYSSLVKKKKGNKYQQQSNQNKQKQPQTIALDQAPNATTTETTETPSVSATPILSSRGTDFWDVGFGAGNEQKKGESKKTTGQGAEKDQRRQPKSQKPNNNQKRGQSQLIIEDTSIRAKIVPKKIPKDAFPTLGGTYVDEPVEGKEEVVKEQESENPVNAPNEEPFIMEASGIKDEHSLVASAFGSEPIDLSVLENI